MCFNHIFHQTPTTTGTSPSWGSCSSDVPCPPQAGSCFLGWLGSREGCCDILSVPRIHMELSHQGWSQRDPGAASKCQTSVPAQPAAPCPAFVSLMCSRKGGQASAGSCWHLPGSSEAQELAESVWVSAAKRERTNGAGLHPRMEQMDRCLLHSPGSSSGHGLRLADARLAFPFTLPQAQHLPPSQNAQNAPRVCLPCPPQPWEQRSHPKCLDLKQLCQECSSGLPAKRVSSSSSAAIGDPPLEGGFAPFAAISAFPAAFAPVLQLGSFRGAHPVSAAPAGR